MALQNPSLPLPSKVAPETIGRAVDSLLKWIKSKALHQKSQLFEHDEFIYLVLTLKKIPPKGRTNPHKIPLPNPLHPFDASEELCLIIDDRPRSSLTSEFAKKKIQLENIPISKVLKFSKLKSDYRPFEAKRKLCTSYDLFFADKRVIPMLPRCLGKEFFKKKKIPIGVDLGRKNWKEQVEGACRSALLFLRSGTCSVVKVGRISQTRDEILENVMAVIDGSAELVPRKWGNIRSFHLKVSESVALPIYQTVPEVGLKIEGTKKEKEEEKKVDSQGESREEKSEKKEKNRKKKRGRIHEVRYMDNKVGEEFDDMFSDKDDDNKDESFGNGPLELDGGELSGKKRNKSGKLIREEVVDLKGKNKLKKLVKTKKGEPVKKKKKKSVVSSEELEPKVDNEAVPNGIHKSAAKLKEISVVNDVDADLLVGTKKPTKLKEATKPRKVGRIGAKGEEHEADNGDEVVGGTLASCDQMKKKSKAEKTGSTGIKLKKKVAKLRKGGLIESKGEEHEANDGDEVVGGTLALGDQMKKKSKAEKTGSMGIKLKTKKNKRL